MKDILDRFVEGLKSSYGENLKSVVLYGSKVNAADASKHSDYNILVVLKAIEFRDLKVMHKAIIPWIAHGNHPPLLFTSERLAQSTDVFPIEFLDIKDNHRILYGEDPFSGLEINDIHLRHECEFELRGKLLKLRQGYMLIRGKKSKLKELLIGSISSFLVVFRYVLRVSGDAPPIERMEALKAFAKKAGFNPGPFITIFNMKRGDKEALKADPESLLEEYLAGIEKAVDYVDAMKV